MYQVLVVPRFVGLLRPLTYTMLEVKWELCGGNQTFVMDHSIDSQTLGTMRQMNLHSLASLRLVFFMVSWAGPKLLYSFGF